MKRSSIPSSHSSQTARSQKFAPFRALVACNLCAGRASMMLTRTYTSDTERFRALLRLRQARLAVLATATETPRTAMTTVKATGPNNLVADFAIHETLLDFILEFFTNGTLTQIASFRALHANLCRSSIHELHNHLQPRPVFPSLQKPQKHTRQQVRPFKQTHGVVHSIGIQNRER